MPPRKKKNEVPAGQRAITSFFGSSSRSTQSEASHAPSGSTAAGPAADTAAGTAAAASRAASAAAEQGAAPGLAEQRQPSAPQNFKQEHGQQQHPRQHQVQQLAQQRNPTMSNSKPTLSSTAAHLAQRLNQTVGRIAAGQVVAGQQQDSRYYSSRTARHAAGEDRQSSQQQQQQQGQQQQQLEALRRAYLQTTCFTRLNPQQRKAAMGDHKKPLLIVAGAGTGKTSTLITRILYLLSQPEVLPQHILCITFTNKAAEELQTRLQQAMKEARAIAAAAGAAAAGVQQQQQPADDEDMGCSGVLACTFHSYCYRLLRRHFRACGFTLCPAVWLDKDARPAMRLAMKLADVDRCLKQMQRWLNVDAAVHPGWKGVQIAAAQQHPQIMQTWFAEQREAKQKAEAAAAKKRQKKLDAEVKKQLKSMQGGKRKQGSKQQQPLSKGQQKLDASSFQRRAGKLQRGHEQQDVSQSEGSVAPPGQDDQQQHQHEQSSMPPPPPALPPQQPIQQQQSGWQQNGWQQQQQQNGVQQQWQQHSQQLPDNSQQQWQQQQQGGQQLHPQQQSHSQQPYQQQQPQWQQQQQGRQLFGGQQQPSGPWPVKQEQHNGQWPGQQQQQQPSNRQWPGQQQQPIASTQQQQEQNQQNQQQAGQGEQQQEGLQQRGGQEQLAGLVLQNLQHEGKVRLYELLLQHYGEEGLYEGSEAAPSVAALRQKTGIKEVKRVHKVIDGFKSRGEKPDVGNNVSVYAHYQALLRQCNAVDFNDLLGHVVELLASHEGILKQQQHLRPFLLVDEYQDCNKQQVTIVDQLQGGRGQVTVVGDDAQSIYGFRGAAPGVFDLYKTAYEHADLVCELENNYRSTPQILKVAEAVLEGCDTHPKKLIPQTSAEGKAPVKLLLLDTEDHEAAVIAEEAKRLHEQQAVAYKDMAVLFRCFQYRGSKAHTKLQKAPTREGVPFVLVRDTSLFERKEVKDVMAYAQLSLNPNDDPAFERVLNVPPRRLGAKLLQQLREEQEQMLASGRDTLLEQSQLQQQQQQAEGAQAQEHSLYSTAWRLLRSGDIATLHAKKLQAFLETLQELYADVRGLTPADALLAVLRGVPGLVEDIQQQQQKKRKKEKDGAAAAAAEEEQEQEDDEEQQSQPQQAEADIKAEEQSGSQGVASGRGRGRSRGQGRGRGRGRQQQSQRSRGQPNAVGDSSAAAAAAASAAASAAAGFVSARQRLQQQQIQAEDDDEAVSVSCTLDSMATANTAATSAAAADSDADSSSSDESSDGSDDESDSSEAADADGAAAFAAAVDNAKPPELVTYALEALHEEAAKFSAQWAAENGVAAAGAASTAPAAGDGAGSGSAPSAADARLSSSSSTAAAAAGTQGVPGSQNIKQEAPAAAAAAGAGAVVPSLFELMAQQVMQQWSSRELLASGVMTDFMLEELYASAGKGSRPLQDFIAHVALNPHTEQVPQNGKHGHKQQHQAQADALVISTIHAAKGLEYGCVWVVRWVDGFLPAWPREDDAFKAKSQAEQQEALRACRMEEQRLAHVAVTRAKQRLYLTCPKYRWPPRAAQQQQQVDERDDNVLAPSDFLLKLLLLKGSMLAANTPVLIEENLRVLS